MNIQLSDLLFLGLLTLCLMYWWKTQGIKQRALQAVKAHCENVDVQLLDESLVLKRVFPRRDRKGLLRLLRRFEFEFSSTGDHRYPGYIILVGLAVEEIYLQPHRIN